VLELTADATHNGTRTTTTWWVDPVSYLPVRIVTADQGITNQVDYAFLPPTPANIASLRVTVPPGFTKTPTQKLP
jgi:hypothetical protein